MRPKGKPEPQELTAGIKKQGNYMNESPQFAAHAVANNTVLELIEAGIPADDIADALMTKGLAVWAADTGRHTAARELLRVWTEVRDYGR